MHGAALFLPGVWMLDVNLDIEVIKSNAIQLNRIFFITNAASTPSCPSIPT